MLDQTFSLLDLPRLLVLIFLECALSADNALAIAAIASHLPKDRRKKALWIGSLSSLVLRLGAILAAAFFIRYRWLQISGALYLFWVVWSGLRKKTTEKLDKIPFWRTVIKIELTDLVFAIDSILAAIALTGLTYNPPGLPHKLWIVYLAGLIGLFAMRYAATWALRLMDKRPSLKLSAHLVVAWVGLKMLAHALSLTFPYEEYVFWLGIILLLGLGLIRHGRDCK